MIHPALIAIARRAEAIADTETRVLIVYLLRCLDDLIVELAEAKAKLRSEGR